MKYKRITDKSYIFAGTIVSFNTNNARATH